MWVDASRIAEEKYHLSTHAKIGTVAMGAFSAALAAPMLATEIGGAALVSSQTTLSSISATSLGTIGSTGMLGSGTVVTLGDALTVGGATWLFGTESGHEWGRFVGSSGFSPQQTAALLGLDAMGGMLSRGEASSSTLYRVATEFSGAPLVQGELKTSALLKGDLSTPIYRLAGGDAPHMGRSWTTIDPRSFSNIPDFKQAAGIGSWNTGDTILIGRLRSLSGAVGRTALPIEGIPNPWLPEIRLNRPAAEMIDLLETVPAAR
jgi:hypothetical protein